MQASSCVSRGSRGRVERTAGHDGRIISKAEQLVSLRLFNCQTSLPSVRPREGTYQCEELVESIVPVAPMVASKIVFV